MPISIPEADSYINLHVIDVEDWLEADEARKQRILNVASRILTQAYPVYIIPDNAVYEFAAVLANATNDTNKLQMQGIEQFSITDVGSFKFNRSVNDYADLIPQISLDFIAIENGLGSLKKGAIKALWTVF